MIKHVELVVTEKCTLKCRHCASRMPYYKHPSDLAWGGGIEEFDQFLSAVDLLLELRILGGEPFLYQDLHKLVNRYVKCEKIKRITIYTNATVVPDQKAVQALHAANVSVHISDYGQQSKKLKELQQIFTDQGISHTVHHYEKWYDMGPVTKRDYEECQLETMYDGCYAAKCHTFLNGKLYICPRAAHGESLGFFRNGPGETVDFKKGRTDRNEKRQQLLQMLDGKKRFEACRYCKGCGNQSPEVKAAEQMEKDRWKYCSFRLRILSGELRIMSWITGNGLTGKNFSLILRQWAKNLILQTRYFPPAAKFIIFHAMRKMTAGSLPEKYTVFWMKGMMLCICIRSSGKVYWSRKSAWNVRFPK